MSINSGHKEACGKMCLTGWSFYSVEDNEIHKDIHIFCRKTKNQKT